MATKFTLITQMKQIKLLSEAMVTEDAILCCPYIFDQLVSMAKARHIWPVLVNRAAFFLAHWTPGNFARCTPSELEAMLLELATIMLILAIIATQPRAFSQDWKDLVGKIDSGARLHFFLSLPIEIILQSKQYIK